MELNARPGKETRIISKRPTVSRRRAFVASLQKVESRARSAREKLEDICLCAQIPDWIRKHLTFYRLHCTYFLLIIIVGTSILYIAHRSDSGERRFSLVDSIFNTVSIVTVTGITSVRIADFSLFDKILLLILMTLGSPVFTSLLPLYVRRFYFFRHHRMYVKECMYGHCPMLESRRLSFPCDNPGPGDAYEEDGIVMIQRNLDASFASGGADNQLPKKNPSFSSPVHSMGPDSGSQHGHGQLAIASKESQRLVLTVDIVKAFSKPDSKIDLLDGISKENQMTVVEKKKSEASDHVDIDGIRFFKPRQLRVPRTPDDDPSSSPLNIMKSIEHQGLVALCWLVPTYLAFTQLVSFALCLFIFSVSPHALRVLQERSLNTAFFSVSTTIAAFTNSGVPAHDDNMVPFQSQCFLLLLYTLISLMGNLLYPPCLRLVISALHGFASESRQPVYSYLLNHPRRCFTHLFPCRQSFWLCLTVLGFTLFQLIFFCTLDWHSDALAGLDPVAKVIDGIYQSVSVRNAGGAVVAISELASSMLVLYLFMMLIAAYPVALLRQNSTELEYEHTELGIYNKGWEEKLTDNSITFQSKKLLAKDSVYLCVILFLICLIESRNIQDDPLNYAIFNIIFEVVSAYGGVGMSIGYSCGLRLAHGDEQLGSCTDVPYSFSGKWSPAGRIILAVAMFMGRHRGLPDDIDSAIKLPSFKEIPLSATGVSITGPAACKSSAPSPVHRFEAKSLHVANIARRSIDLT